MPEAGKRHGATVYVIDDDAIEHVILRRLARASSGEPTLMFAMTEGEIRETLPGADADLLLCDNRVPPFEDYREIVPLVRSLGYDGPIVVYSSSTDDACFQSYRDFGVAEVVDKTQLDSRLFDQLLARATV